MSAKVYITGIGIISALGSGVQENLSALKELRAGISHPHYLESLHKEHIIMGEVNASNAMLAEQAGLHSRKYHSRTALLGLIAANEAILQAGLAASELQKAGIVSGTTVGGMDISEQHYMSLRDPVPLRCPTAFMSHDCGFSTQFIATNTGIQSHISTISTACSSSANAIMHAARLIKSGKLDCVIAGGTDALSLFTLNGFNALRILSPDHCKPFDLERKGLNLGEGAAYLVLESEAHAKQRGAIPLASIAGYGNANDVYHQTASSPEGNGAFNAMQAAINLAEIDVSVVDYLNAHGTGTENNDLTESRAMQRLFGSDMPDYSSTKAYTGHTLGAAGAIEAVFSVLAIQHGIKYPNYNMDNPMENLQKMPLNKLITTKVEYVLSNSFGFGGNCTSLLFSN